MKNKTTAERKKLKWENKVFQSDISEAMDQEWIVGERRNWPLFRYLSIFSLSGR